MLNIYAELVRNEYDVPGALAYSIYKRCKAEWRASFPATHNGNEPTVADEIEFVAICMLPENLESLKQRGAKLARDFAAKSLEKRMMEIADEVAESEVIRQISFLINRVDIRFDGIDKQLNAKKTLRAWGRDIVTAFIAGLGVILAVGLLFNGYVRFAAINAAAEKAVGIDLETQQRKAGPLRK